MKKILFLTFVFILFSVGNAQVELDITKSDLSKDVCLTTDMGEIIFRLSDETPKHRNNFIKLVNKGFYDGLAFHRVIEHFLVQTGNPRTRATPKVIPEVPYTLPAETNPNLFHKRGAINAARMGDDTNPSQASSGTQFTIIQGKTYTDSTLAVAEKRINTWLAYNRIINHPEHKPNFEKYATLLEQSDSLKASVNDKNQDVLKEIENELVRLKAQLDSLTKIEVATTTGYSYPQSHREVYKTFGGAAHLDQNYTVFGEVVKGMDIVDRIAAVATDEADKPLKDVRILTAKMIDRKSYD